MVAAEDESSAGLSINRSDYGRTINFRLISRPRLDKIAYNVTYHDVLDILARLVHISLRTYFRFNSQKAKWRDD